MNLVILRTTLVTAFAAAVCLAVSPRAGAAVKNTPIAHFVAKAVSVSDDTAAGRIDIVIERWSTDEEWENLRGTLIESGPGKLLPVLQTTRPPAGVVLMPGILGHGARARTRRMRPLQFAREIETPAGRRVVIATDQDLEFGERTPQYLGFGERTRRPPPEYAFTLLDIRFGPDGKGVGKLAPATMVVYNKETKTIEIENYGAQPVRLTEVRSEKP